MRKQRHYSVFTLVSFFLLFGFSGMILINSCRKTDNPALQEKTNSELEQKFFNSHVSADPVVKSVTSFVKGQNDKYQFVEKLVKQIGFPYWDKAMTFSKVGGSTAGRGLTDSSYITYIPFVRDSQNFVNASLIIRIDQTDTAFRFLFDWQYDNYGFDSTGNDWNAKNVFHVFANFDRSIFGTTEFTITDGRIFGLDEAVHPTAKLVDTILSSGRSFLQAVTLCGTIEICVPGGQARNNVVGCNTVLQWVCTTVWLDIPPCCTTPPPPGGGGGGGTGGGWTPPPCGPNSARGAVQEGCIPGWMPTGIPDDEIWSDFSNLTNPVNLPDDQVITNGASLQDLPWPPGNGRRIAHTRNRNNTEDMAFGTNGNPIGISPTSLTSETDNFLFGRMTNLFHWCTIFDNDLSVVGDDMITKFENNTGGTYQNSVLNDKVKASSAFKNFLKQFAVDLDNKLIAAGGNINNVQDFEVNFRPVFNGRYNKTHGLQILINDTEFTEIQLDNFTNLSNGDWTADVTVIIHDHFGLDKNDALTYQNFHEGFPSWWILQHMRSYRPFETIVTVRQNITFHH